MRRFTLQLDERIEPIVDHTATDPSSVLASLRCTSCGGAPELQSVNTYSGNSVVYGVRGPIGQTSGDTVTVVIAHCHHCDLPLTYEFKGGI